MIDLAKQNGREIESTEEENERLAEHLLQRAARRHGRTTTYSHDTAAEIISRIIDGETLRQICRDESMPSNVCVYYWMEQMPGLASAIRHARSLQGESWGEQAVSEVMREIPEDDIPRGKIMVQQQRTRADTLLKAAGRRDPERWGEKPSASAGVALQIVTNLGMSEDQPAGEMSVEAKPSSGSDDSKR